MPFALLLFVLCLKQVLDVFAFIRVKGEHTN